MINPNIHSQNTVTLKSPLINLSSLSLSEHSVRYFASPFPCHRRPIQDFRTVKETLIVAQDGTRMAAINFYTMPIFSKDYHGRERMPPLPLSFALVNERRSSRSHTALFKLPTEILNLIIQSLASDSLTSLALVNRDCLQMARSRQFASINLEYDSTGFQIRHKLLSEGQQ